MAQLRAEHVLLATVLTVVRVLGVRAQVALVPVTKPVITILATIRPKLKQHLVTTAELSREPVLSVMILTVARVHGDLAHPVNVQAVKLVVVEVA